MRQRVLLREEAAPRLAEHVVALSQAERVDEIVELADEEIDRPEVGAPLRVVRAAPVADLVVVDDGAAAVGQIRDREQVVVRRPRPAVEDDQRRECLRVVWAQLVRDAVPGLGRLVADVERNRALAGRHAATLPPRPALPRDRRRHVLLDLCGGESAVVDPHLVAQWASRFWPAACCLSASPGPPRRPPKKVRVAVFDINDFDETAPGPWEWDVKRLAASFAIGGRENGFSGKERRAVVLDTVRSYREAMTAFAEMRNLDLWYSHLSVEQAVAEFTAGVDPKRLKKAEANIEKSRTKDSMHAFEKLTHLVDGEPRIISDPPLIVPIEELLPEHIAQDAVQDEMRDLIRSYRRTLETDRRHLLEQFRFVHLARKVVGVGSVGTRAWIALFLGIDEQDPLFLQIKEAQPSVLEQFVGKSEYKNSGRRVVAGQRLMQATSDIFLGWQHVSSGLDGKERDFYVRQLKDWKGSFAFEAAVPAGAAAYGKACGWTLARAHARAGDRVAIASYLGKSDVFDRAIAAFAETYADQNERDYNALKDAVNEGRITAQTGL